MDELLEYLTSVPAWYLATCEGDQPHVRPFSFAAVEEGTLWFSTSKDKDVYEQLMKNPRFELCSWWPGHGWAVLTGVASMEDTASDAVREEGFKHMVALGEAHESARDGRLTFFSLKEGTARIDNIDGSSREVAL